MKSGEGSLRPTLIVTRDSREMLVDRYDGSVSGLRRMLQVMCETM